VAPSPPDLLQPGRWSWSLLSPFAAPAAAGGRGISFLRCGLVIRIRFYLFWRVVGIVRAAFGWINLPQLYSHVGDGLQGGVSELMATCAGWPFRSAAWSSRWSSDLARSVSQCVTDVRGFSQQRWRPGEMILLERGCWSGGGGFAVLLRLTSSMRAGRSWSKTAWGHLSVDVPQRHMPRCMQRACSSTHKAFLAMVLSRILQWWRLGVSYGVRLGDAKGGQRPLATVVAWNLKDRFIFSDLLGFYL
jgi:hypothetical protein